MLSAAWSSGLYWKVSKSEFFLVGCDYKKKKKLNMRNGKILMSIHIFADDVIEKLFITKLGLKSMYTLCENKRVYFLAKTIERSLEDWIC